MAVPQGEDSVVMPNVTTHAEFVHVEPEGQTRHEAPHAPLSFVVLVHAPPQQFPPAHVVPLAALPVAEQLDCPELQDVVPVWQVLGGVPGLHAAPAVQATQAPLSQTSLEPHAVPLAALPVTAQLDCPELQDVVPIWQTVAPVHAAPAVQPPPSLSKVTDTLP
jgi:hypothetical protein